MWMRWSSVLWKTWCSFSPLRATALGISSSMPERVCHYYSNTLSLPTKLSQQHCPSAWLPMTYLHTILNTAERTTWPSAATTTGSTTPLLRAASVFCSPLPWRQGGPSSAGQWGVLTLSATGQSHTQTCWKWCNRVCSFYLCRRVCVRLTCSWAAGKLTSATISVQGCSTCRRGLSSRK